MKSCFFSEELVIPICDRLDAAKKSEALLRGLQQGFQPVSVLETWYATNTFISAVEILTDGVIIRSELFHLPLGVTVTPILNRVSGEVHVGD